MISDNVRNNIDNNKFLRAQIVQVVAFVYFLVQLSTWFVSFAWTVQVFGKGSKLLGLLLTYFLVTLTMFIAKVFFSSELCL